MQCKLFLVHLVVIVSASTASGARLSADLVTPLCADTSLEDLIETSEACQLAESLGSGVDCWENLDALLQLCLDEAAAAGHLEMANMADKLKRNRNKFLGKRSAVKRDGGVRNNFLGKRDAIGRLRNTINAFLRKQMAAAENDEKRSRNRFLGKRTDNDDGFEVDSAAMEKRSRNKFLVSPRISHQ